MCTSCPLSARLAGCRLPVGAAPATRAPPLPLRAQASLKARTRFSTAARCSAGSSEARQREGKLAGALAGASQACSPLSSRCPRCLPSPRARPSLPRSEPAAGWTAPQARWSSPTASWIPITTGRCRAKARLWAEGKALRRGVPCASLHESVWACFACLHGGRHPRLTRHAPAPPPPHACTPPPTLPLPTPPLRAGGIHWRMANPPGRSTLAGLAYAGGIGGGDPPRCNRAAAGARPAQPRLAAATCKPRCGAPLTRLPLLRPCPALQL